MNDNLVLNEDFLPILVSPGSVMAYLLVGYTPVVRKPAIIFLLVMESCQAEFNNWENTWRVTTMPGFSDRYV